MSIPPTPGSDYGASLYHSDNLEYVPHNIESGTNGNGATETIKTGNPVAPPIWNTIAQALFGK
jgi:hypothetical protein